MSELTPVQLAAAVAALHRQVAVALWLAGGMVLAITMLGLLACQCRRCALLAGGAYAATLCFVPVGHAHVLGPCGLGLAAAGLLRTATGRSR